MKRPILVGIVVAAMLTGCATTPEQTAPDPEPSAVGVDDYLLDGVFVAPSVDFSGYQRLLVTDLNLDEWRPSGLNLPLQPLNHTDRRFFQQEYAQSLVHFLVADGAYELALEPGDDVLQVDARLHQTTLSQEVGEQLGVADPQDMVVIVLSMELYDSLSGRMLMTLVDRQPLGRAANHSTSPVTPLQIRRAFSQWMQYLRENLDELSRDV